MLRAVAETPARAGGEAKLLWSLAATFCYASTGNGGPPPRRLLPTRGGRILLNLLLRVN